MSPHDEIRAADELVSCRRRALTEPVVQSALEVLATQLAEMTKEEDIRELQIHVQLDAIYAVTVKRLPPKPTARRVRS